MKPILLTIFAFLATTASANATGCPEHYLDARMPQLTNDVLYDKANELCYIEFGIVHSGLTRTPLWAAEHLSAARVSAARGIDREDVFEAEGALPSGERSELSDYSRSGFDRGHVAPAGDMSSSESKAESFTLANIVPQTASSNRSLWADVESTVRDLAAVRGDVYVVTGPLFVGEELRVIGSGVLVPSHMFKAVHVPSTGETGAYLVSNDDAPQMSLISVADVAALAGFDPFPTLGPDLKSSPSALPTP